MMRPRYPVEENCSGSCVDCVEDTGTRTCSCNFARVKCQVRTKAEQQENKIELVAYNEDPRFLFGLVSPFSKKKDLYQVMGCDYECRKVSPDVAAAFAEDTEVRIVETEPAGDGSPLKLRLSRRELSTLQLPLATCNKHPEDNWSKLEVIGRYPCNGDSGIIMCRKDTSSGCKFYKWWSCEKFRPVSCHRFGPVLMDVFAVQDAIKHHVGGFDSCVVRCDGKDAIKHQWLEEAEKVLLKDRDYVAPPANTALHPKEFVPLWHRADTHCSSACGSDLEACPNARNCLCRIAHAKCNVQVKGLSKPLDIESWGFNARMQDVFGMLSIPGANAKDAATEHIQTKNCRTDCHKALWSSL
ncbi:hypothetical protein GNI_104440 [Gregarina niphandrodes]|uniref:Uncharacterized protein n=1 Tax=Gregarina niphandrodes TaxID=110365 RepID=A0A023B461_GRENI|nr:hypothetical protein GNI_104440 [Gregarina niphandrodes]EZG56289.1 hypothetical protein GNI_104440 [Gregarina niphandrodes]|eukprot:XP_011131298.1 hypothetical protein GNI_104440 [Gregarina niphandrodes]